MLGQKDQPFIHSVNSDFPLSICFHVLCFLGPPVFFSTVSDEGDAPIETLGHCLPLPLFPISFHG